MRCLKALLAATLVLHVRIAAISDLHIGVSARHDEFGHDLRRFEAFLDALEAEHDKVVLLGDIYQTDHVVWPSRSRRWAHLSRARRRAEVLSRRFEAEPYVYVFGNHDSVAAEQLGAPETVRLQGRAAAALFIHGHQFDPVAVRASWAADLGTWATGRLRALGLRPLARYLEGRDVAIKDRRFSGEDGPYVSAGRSLAAAHEVQIVVMGHTHCPRLDPIRGGVVLNTGTCSGGRFSHVSLDLGRGTARLHAPDGRKIWTLA